MLNDLDLIQHSFPGDIDIYPIADVHLGAVEHAETEWQSFVKRVEKENAYLVLAGDLLNNSTRGTRFANPFDEVLRPREAKRRMVEYLKPLAESGKVLAVCGGNHEYRTVKESDQDITYDICAKLNIEHLYRENIAFIKIALGSRNRRNTTPLASYVLAMMHGKGGGVLTGSSVNNTERFGGSVLEGVDCIITAHVHKGFVTRPSKIVVDGKNNVVKMRSYTAVSCVSWLSYGGYAARSMLIPAEISNPQRLRLVCSEKCKKIITTW